MKMAIMVMYEYEFKGFQNAKSLYHDESIELNGNMMRHFLKNDLGKTYFYDEYMNSQINFTPDERMNYLNRRISSLEDRLQHDGEENPLVAQRIRGLAEKAVDVAPQGFEVGITNLRFQILLLTTLKTIHFYQQKWLILQV